MIQVPKMYTSIYIHTYYIRIMNNNKDHYFRSVSTFITPLPPKEK